MEVGEEYKWVFELFGVDNVYIFYIFKCEVVFQEVIYQVIERCDVVMFIGGDQFWLMFIFGGIFLYDLIVEKYYIIDFVYVGIFVGVVVVLEIMIYQGWSVEVLLKGEIKIIFGFGLIDDVVIDIYFVQCGCFG